MKLNKQDKKMFSYLYHHYREPLTKIAKACRISRDQVEYRLKKYEKEGIIKKYLTIFNYSLLGYNEFVIVWLKIKNNKELIKKELKSMKKVITLGDEISSYDLFVDFVFKNKLDFEKEFYSFLKKHEADIIDYSIFTTSYGEFYPLKTFGFSDEEKIYVVSDLIKTIQLKNKDLEILKILEKNGRTKIIDIARKTGLSSELIVYKLKQFYKNKIILGVKIQFDIEKLGFYFGNLRIKLKNLDGKTRKELRTFCKQHKHINALFFGLGDYNCLIQVFYQNEEEFRKTIKDINKKFKNQIETSQIFLIENESEAKTLPI